MSVATTLKSQAAALRLPTHRDPYYAGKWQKASRYAEKFTGAAPVQK